MLQAEELSQPDRFLYGEAPTPRQLQILQLIANGLKDAQIAKELGMSREALRSQVRYSRSKIGAKNRTQAVAIALRSSLIRYPE